jgi:S1-C subfamily serine protease
MLTTDFLLADGVLISVQALLVALPGRGIPEPLQRLGGRAWALVLPISIAAVVAAIALDPAVADWLTWVALVAVPPLAAAALGWAVRGARPALALLALPLLALALADTGGLAGDAAAAALTALSCVTLGRLLAGAVPGSWLKAGIVAMALIDAVLVFGNQLQAPNAVLTAALPGPGLPQLQTLDLHAAGLGYGDVFVAGVLGGVLAAERASQWPVALLVLGFSVAWDTLFFAVDTLPATVPVAAALLVAETVRRRRHGRVYLPGRRKNSRPRADDSGAPVAHDGWVHSTRAGLLAAIPILLVVAALAGCGSGSSGGGASSGGAGVPETAGAAAVQRQFTKVVADVSPQVVQIQSGGGLGSGIVYDDKGDIVTNAHVTAGSKRFLVTLAGGGRRDATLVGADAADDIAVIHIAGGNPAPAIFADSSRAVAGEIVFAIGNPLGLQSSVTQGIVSSINRQVGEGNGVTLSNVLQTSAQINPGNSGGALVDLSGRVVGVPTLAALDPELGNTEAAGIGFAIPSNMVRQVADRVIGGGASQVAVQRVSPLRSAAR